MYSHLTYAQVVKGQAAKMTSVAAGMVASSIPTNTVPPSSVQPSVDLDSQPAVQQFPVTEWVKDKTSEVCIDGLTHQVLNPLSVLNAPFTVDGGDALPTNSWKSSILKWSKWAFIRFKSENKSSADGQPKPSKEETECMAAFIFKTLSASHVHIIAPSHSFTTRQRYLRWLRIETEPHVTMKVIHQDGSKYTLHVHYNIVQRGPVHHPQGLDITWVTRAVRNRRDIHEYLVHERNL